MMIKIREMEVRCEIIHRQVKNSRLEIRDGFLRLILPNGVNNYQHILQKNEEWIYKKLVNYNQLQIYAEKRDLDLNRDNEKFKRLVISYMNQYSRKMQVKVNKITFKKMKSRWGSCSSQRNISINLLLKCLPTKLIEYVCFHELAHLIERKHDKNFWKIIREEYPDYKEIERELSIYWLKVKDL
jgi:predicted metal-dependent hydrolase